MILLSVTLSCLVIIPLLFLNAMLSIVSSSIAMLTVSPRLVEERRAAHVSTGSTIVSEHSSWKTSSLTVLSVELAVEKTRSAK